MDTKDKKLELLNAYINNAEYSKEFIDKLDSLFENPIFVFDPSFRLYVTSYKEKIKNDTYLKKYNNNYVLSLNVLDEVINSKLLEEIETSKKTIVKNLKTFNSSIMVKKIEHRGIVLGYFCVYAKNRPFSESDKELVDTASAIFSHYKVLKGNNLSFYQVIFTNIINKEYSSREELDYVLSNINVKIPKKMRVMVSSGESPQILVDYLLNTYPEIYSFMYKGGVVTIIYPERDKTDKIIKELAKQLKADEYKIGISDVFSDLFELDKYYKHATDAIEITKKLSIDRKVNYYDDYKMLSFVTKLDKDDINNLVDNRVKSMIKYDEVHKTRYLEDINIYFSSARNINDAAKSLFIHKNSMYYRLQKIKELFGINLESEEDCFKIEFSLILLQLI